MRPPISRLLAFAVVLLLATACGGNADAGPATGDYFAQLQRVSETAHVQERGLGRDLRVRLDETPPGEDRLVVVTVFLDQSARLYQDVVDALESLDPPEELAAAQQAYLEAWREQLELTAKLRDAGFATAGRILGQLEAPAFSDAAEETRATCDDLQAAVAGAGSDVDLVCDGIPT
jgi:hypothetical protein